MRFTQLLFARHESNLANPAEFIAAMGKCATGVTLITTDGAGVFTEEVLRVAGVGGGLALPV